jgi:hypothetical protein
MADPAIFESDRRVVTIGLTDALATIVVAEDSGPIRTIINGRSLRPTMRFASCKARAFAIESAAERALAFSSEADPAVATMLSQPHRLEFTTSGGAQHTYIPDMRRDLRSGVVDIIECKADDRPDKRGPGYQRKLALAGEIYRKIGWQFRVVTFADIAVEPRYTSLIRIARDGHLKLAPQERHRATDLLSRGPVTLGELSEAVAPGPRGKAVVFHLTCHGVLAIDLRRPLGEASLVRLYDPAMGPLT